jgi:hypothetical protein
MRYSYFLLYSLFLPSITPKHPPSLNEWNCNGSDWKCAEKVCGIATTRCSLVGRNLTSHSILPAFEIGSSEAMCAAAIQRVRQDCNEIVMMEGSEPAILNTQRTTRSSLQVIEESNKVDRFQNAATPCCVLIIRRSVVRVHAPPPYFDQDFSSR